MEENKKNKNIIGYIVILGIVALAAYYFGSSNNQAPTASPTTGIVPSTPYAQKSGQVYDYTEASMHIGEYASVRGQVAKVYKSAKGTIFFDYCINYRTCNFSAVIFASSAGNFNNPYQYEGRTVTLTGLIKTYQGRAEIILENSNQISE